MLAFKIELSMLLDALWAITPTTSLLQLQQGRYRI
jgi:hypothetical protein